jgi:hypothetical protein
MVVPCSDRRHTGEYIGELSNSAWTGSGIVKPTEEIFARISDNSSNMIKGWKDGFQVPCVDHTEELSVNLYTNHLRLEGVTRVAGLWATSTRVLLGTTRREWACMRAKSRRVCPRTR